MCRCRAGALFVAVAIFVSGCGVEETVVARVDGVDIKVDRVQTYLQRVTGSQWAAVDSRAASRIFDQFLEQEAVAMALEERRDGQATAGVERSVLLLRFAKEICGPAPTVAPAEFDAAVASRMVETVPEQVLVRQLLLWDLAEAEEVRARFDQGVEFEDLSRKYSRAPNAENGGLIGWVIRGTQPDDVEGEIFSLEAGQVSLPVEGPAGYHLFQVLEVRASGHVSDEIAAFEVRQELESAGSREHLSRCVDQAVDQAGVVIFKENLWFEYRGRFAED